MSRQTTSTVSAMWANGRPGTRPRPRVWIAGLVAGLAIALALSGVALACEPTPVNCGPIVFRPTGRPLELEIAVGGCSYDTQNFQVSVWVRLRGPGYSRTAGGNSDVGVTGREALVSRTRVTMLNPGQYGLYIEALAASRYGGDVCYTTGTMSVFANLKAATPKPRATPRPTPRPTLRPTAKPTHRPTPKPTAKAAPTTIPAAFIPTLLSPGPAASPPGQAVAASAASGTFPPSAGPTDKGGIPGEAPVVQIGLIVAVAAISLIGLFIVTTGHRARATAGQPWVCPACSSINGKGRTRCYGCCRKFEA